MLNQRLELEFFCSQCRSQCALEVYQPTAVPGFIVTWQISSLSRLVSRQLRHQLFRPLNPPSHGSFSVALFWHFIGLGGLCSQYFSFYCSNLCIPLILATKMYCWCHGKLFFNRSLFFVWGGWPFERFFLNGRKTPLRWILDHLEAYENLRRNSAGQGGPWWISRAFSLQEAPTEVSSMIPSSSLMRIKMAT